MRIPQFTLHVAIDADTTDCGSPSPWWRPFGWINRSRDEYSTGLVVRFGILGVHVCLAGHYYRWENPEE